MGKINNISSISKENRQKKECIILRDVNKRSLEANLDSVSLSGFGGLPLLREEERTLSFLSFDSFLYYLSKLTVLCFLGRPTFFSLTLRDLYFIPQPSGISK